MANVFKGIGISWGTASTAASALGTFKLQSRDHNKKADKEEVRDGDGNVAGVVYYNPTESATFEYIPNSGTAGGAVSPTLPAVGDLVTVTDTTAYTPIAGTSWLVDDVQTKGSNTSALRVTVTLSKYPAITS